MGLKEIIQANLAAAKARRKREAVPAALAEALLGRAPVRGEELYAAQLSAFDADDYEEKRLVIRRVGGETRTELNRRNLRARLVVKALVDAAGNRLFADEDADALGHGLDSAAMGALWDLAAKVNGMAEPGEGEEGGEGGGLKNAPSNAAPTG